MSLNIASMLMALPGIVIGLTVHEYSHAFAAWKLGDTTARDQGRLTLNPLRHIDPLGFLFLVMAGFAGPLSNLALALLVSVALKLMLLALPYSGAGLYSTFLDLLLRIIYVNYALFVFNLIPIPPLDGSHILFTMVDIKPELEAKLYRYGTLALFAVVIIDNRTRLDLLPIGELVGAMARSVFGVLGV